MAADPYANDVQSITESDLCAQPAVVDQQVLIETINYNTNSAGLLQYSPSTTFNSGSPTKGTFTVDYRGLVNVIQITAFPFYIPQYSLWNNVLIQYGGVINMGILEMSNNGWNSSQIQGGGTLNQYQYQFSFKVTPEGDRYLLTPIVSTVNCKNLINFSTGSLTFTFNTQFQPLLIPTPYATCYLTYTNTSTLASFTTYDASNPTNPPPHNFTNGNYVEVFAVLYSVPTNGGTSYPLTSVVLATPYIISVTSPTTFTIPINISTIGTNYQLYVTIFNVSLSISMPLRFRQIEKLRSNANRMVATIS
jgi:hypothetical protein